MRRCPFGGRNATPDHGIVGGRRVKIAARRLARSWPQDEEFEGLMMTVGSNLERVPRPDRNAAAATHILNDR
jgi:hypothetical protein